jgi:hypothetical protein
MTPQERKLILGLFGLSALIILIMAVVVVLA